MDRFDLIWSKIKLQFSSLGTTAASTANSISTAGTGRRSSAGSASYCTINRCSLAAGTYTYWRFCNFSSTCAWFRCECRRSTTSATIFEACRFHFISGTTGKFLVYFWILIKLRIVDSSGTIQILMSINFDSSDVWNI